MFQSLLPIIPVNSLKEDKNMAKNLKQFNMMVIGTGGQGLITILQIISEAALIEGYDIKTSELHGLVSKRRFG